MFKNIVTSQRGSVLLTVLLLSMVISGLILTLLTGSLFQQRSVLYRQDQIRAKYAAESGIEEILAEAYTGRLPGFFPKVEHRIIATNEKIQTVIQRWGLLQRASSRSKIHRSEHTIIATLALAQPDFMTHGLIVNPAYPSLIVTGDTRLIGNVAVGPQGVKKAVTRGRPYTGDKLVYGEINRSREDRRPDVDYPLVRTLFDFFDDQFRMSAESIDDYWVGDSILKFPKWPARPILVDINNDTFGDRELTVNGSVILRAEEDLTLNNIKLGPYVQLICKKQLSISGSARIDGAVVYAKGRVLLKNVKTGKGQFFSRSNIHLIKAKLNYPSILATYSDKEDVLLELSAGSSVEGSALLLTDRFTPFPRQLRGKLLIHKGARLFGLAFSDNLCELAGEVNGTVITDRFHFYSSPTDYYNRIMDGRIERRLLKQMELPLLFEEKPILTVVERL